MVINMEQTNVEVKLIKCFDYGVLREILFENEKTWIFNAEGYEYAHINCTFIETLNEMSMEGWDLVCQDGLGYIFRKSAMKEEPQPGIEADEEADEKPL
jgi:hypothetical protein